MVTKPDSVRPSLSISADTYRGVLLEESQTPENKLRRNKSEVSAYETACCGQGYHPYPQQASLFETRLTSATRYGRKIRGQVMENGLSRRECGAMFP